MEEQLELESILKTVRGAMGLYVDDTSFDYDLILYINGALAILNQNGVGQPLVVKGEDELWEQFKTPSQTIGNEIFEMVKLYVFMKTRIPFDPPSPSTLSFMQESLDELLWRLRESYDMPIKEGVELNEK